MFYLDRIKENRLYNKFPISGVEQNQSNKKKGTAILILSKNKQVTIDVINARIFSPMNFRSFYMPRRIVNKYSNKTKIVQQKAYYDEIKMKTDNVSIFLNTLEAYKERNVFFDMSQEIEFFESVTKTVGKKRVDIFKVTLAKRIEEIKKLYKNVIIVCPITEAMDVSFVNKANAKTVQEYVYYLMIEPEFSGTDIMFISLKDRIYFHTKGNNKESQDEVRIRLKALQNKVNKTPNDEQEQIEQTIDISEEEINKNIAPVLRAIGVNVNKVDASIQPYVAAIQDMAADIIRHKEGDTESVESILIKNSEFLEIYGELAEVKRIGVDKVEATKKIEKLTNKQSEIKVGETTIGDIITKFRDTSIEPIELPSKTIDTAIKTSSVKNFDESYAKKMLDKDIASMFTSFNKDPDIKIFASKVDISNTSDDLTNKKTYKVQLEDDKGLKHNVIFDVPIINEGKFIKVNGGKKLIQKQIMLLPIIKTHPDKVQITSNYNKFFVERFGQKTSTRLEALKKAASVNLDQYLKDGCTLNIKKGNAKAINAKLETTLEYLDLSDSIAEITDSKQGINLIFNYNIIRNKLNPNKPEFDESVYDKFDQYSESYLMIGTKSNNIIASDKVTGEIYEIDKEPVKVADSLFDYVYDIFEHNLESGFKSVMNKKPAKSFTYSRIAINSKKLPLITILGYELGLKEVLERYGIEYEFTTEKPSYNAKEKMDSVRFADGYLLYNTSLIRNSLLMAGLNAVGCEGYTFDEMDTIEPYLDMFYNITGSRNAGKGIHNNLSLMIDPITEDVLKSMNLPTDIYEILLYANTLLEDVTFKRMNDMSTYRIRCAEQIPAMIYSCLANAVREYKDRNRNGAETARISMPKDIILKKMLELATVDEYSTLNPSLEIERSSSATYKGISGKTLAALKIN